ncbi:MAG: hypothetical protein ABW076_03020 [Candidatus Thiodiazotropha sp.]
MPNNTSVSDQGSQKNSASFQHESGIESVQVISGSGKQLPENNEYVPVQFVRITWIDHA